ncbi:carboxypeptidase regulatory-like domain-containing protein [Rubrivirga sp.]|uniref:carboxypeptidase regulatory-like domain-containing protein n=1 Tax=Rubrivirga sp. TaxID=1885344 RepID=UPI003B51C4A6
MTTRLLFTALALALAAPASAQTETRLDDALRDLAERRGLRLVYAPDLVAGKRTACPAVTRASNQPAEAVLACVLAGTGVESRPLPSGTVALYRAPVDARPARSAPAPPAERVQATHTLSGFVSDEATGEVLAGAAVYAPALSRGVTTNAYGFYSLPLPAGEVRVVASSVGYEARAETVALGADRRLDLALAPASIGEVVVEADEDGADLRPETELQMGRVALTGADVQGLPALLGEADVLKAVQLLPGVRGGQEGTAGLYVRGGSPDQTLILLDGVPVYNSNHLFGFLSTFNGDAVQRVELTKGAYPARYGGRLGSVLDVRLRDGDDTQRRVSGQVGLLSTRLLAEGPLSENASFLVSGRRTYADVVARPFIAVANRNSAQTDGQQVDPRAYFYDLNAKLNWRPSERDRVYLSLYRGTDAFGADITEPRPGGAQDRASVGLDWGNVTGSLRGTRVLSPRAFAAVTLAASDYAFDVGVDIEDGVGGPEPTTARAQYRSGIRDLTARVDLDLAAGRGHTLRLGGGAGLHRFTPGALSLVGTGAADTTLGTTPTSGVDVVAYAEDEWRVTDRLTLGLGLHGALYAVGGTVYPSVEPRLAASFRAADRLALKASFATTQQPLHLLTTGGGIGLPADLWVPATEQIGPERGWQAALGAAGSLPSGRTSWTLEGYWREMRGLVAYREGAAFTAPFDDWQDLVEVGEGRSFGLEAFVQHRTDRLTAWAGYTLAKTDRQFDAINSGERFPFRYDRRHDLSLTAQYRLSNKFDVSAAFVYGTGDAVTLPQALYQAPRYGWGDLAGWVRPQGGNDLTAQTDYGPRNGFRLPATARLDLGVSWHFRRGPRPHALHLNVYNATNRKNPFMTTLERGYGDDGRRQLTGLALFPVLPTLSYQFSF